jgi:glycosyltransferase involved in cell wall biosynthesis
VEGKKIMLFSIVIPNYNGEKYFEDLFASLKKQKFKDFEVIFVDNASKDGSVAYVKNISKKSHMQINMIENQINGGFSKACNQGIEQSKGKWIIFMNTDVVFDNTFLEKVSDTISSADERTGEICIQEQKMDETVRHFGAFMSICRHPRELMKPDRKKLIASLGACLIYKNEETILMMTTICTAKTPT